MSSFFKRKGVIAAAIITAVVLVCAAIAHFGGTNPVSKVLRTVFSPFQNGFSYIVNKVTDTTDFIREMNGYKEENARLVHRSGSRLQRAALYVCNNEHGHTSSLSELVSA